MSLAPVRVLLTNDDGPPGRDSPYVLGLYLELKKLGWDVRVLLPASQKSWIGKAYIIRDVIRGQYFYPRENGVGEKCDTPRPLEDGEIGEWILLEGTPATCTNVGIHNLYPGEIDLVVSGPNFGNNTASAFTLSSGTVGAALSGALSQKRSIAVSFGVRSNPQKYLPSAYALASRIIKRLWENWGSDALGLRSGEVDLYNVNLPLADKLLQPEGMEVCWTTIWRRSYAKLFKHQSKSRQETSPAGPGAEVDSQSKSSILPADTSYSSVPPTANLVFTWSPERLKYSVEPPSDEVAYGTDAWAVRSAKASVTPLRATFAAAGEGKEAVPGGVWKW